MAPEPSLRFNISTAKVPTTRSIETRPTDGVPRSRGITKSSTRPLARWPPPYSPIGHLWRVYTPGRLPGIAGIRSPEIAGGLAGGGLRPVSGRGEDRTGSRGECAHLAARRDRDRACQPRDSAVVCGLTRRQFRPRISKHGPGARRQQPQLPAYRSPERIYQVAFSSALKGPFGGPVTPIALALIESHGLLFSRSRGWRTRL